MPSIITPSRKYSTIRLNIPFAALSLKNI
jgi:hypothetical protein